MIQIKDKVTFFEVNGYSADPPSLKIDWKKKLTGRVISRISKWDDIRWIVRVPKRGLWVVKEKDLTKIF